MKAFIPNLEAKLTNYRIDPRFFAEMRSLVEQGTRPSDELRRLLKHTRNYVDCLDSLLTELSRPVIDKHLPSLICA